MKTEIPGGKWSTFHVKSELDLIMGRASKLPAPVSCDFLCRRCVVEVMFSLESMHVYVRVWWA